MAWEPGDSGDRLKTELIAFIERWLEVPYYKDMMPEEHIHVENKVIDRVLVYML